jgi:hypothetical protein
LRTNNAAGPDRRTSILICGYQVTVTQTRQLAHFGAPVSGIERTCKVAVGKAADSRDLTAETTDGSAVRHLTHQQRYGNFEWTDGPRNRYGVVSWTWRIWPVTSIRGALQLEAALRLRILAGSAVAA